MDDEFLYHIIVPEVEHWIQATAEKSKQRAACELLGGLIRYIFTFII